MTTTADNVDNIDLETGVRGGAHGGPPLPLPPLAPLDSTNGDGRSVSCGSSAMVTATIFPAAAAATSTTNMMMMMDKTETTTTATTTDTSTTANNNDDGHHYGQGCQGHAGQAGRTSVIAALPASTIAFNYKATKAPKETLKAVYKAGEYKAALPLNLLMVQSFMAGVYIGVAGQLYLVVGGGLLGSALFPVALIAVVLTSAELFTGDSLVFVASVLGGKVTLGKLCRNWTVSWIMNFVGCLFWSVLMTYTTDVLTDDAMALAIQVAEKKAHRSWPALLILGIGANFLVCIGVWQATCAEEVRYVLRLGCRVVWSFE
jgi:Formate/nitrite transporter